MSFWRYIYKSTWFILGALILTGLACLFVPEYNQYTEYQKRMAALQGDIEAEEQTLKALKIKQDRFKTEKRFVEHVAHEVGMVKENETIFKFYESAKVAASPNAN